MGVKQTGWGKKEATETGGEAHIPYTSHVNSNTLKTRDGKLLQIIKLDGVAHFTSDTDQLNAWNSARNFLWRSVSDNKVSIWTHIVRYKKNDYPKGEFGKASDHNFARELDKRYERSLEDCEMYVNDLYISVVRRCSGDSLTGFAQTLKSMLTQIDKEDSRNVQRKELSFLNDSTRKILKGLAAYHPKLLSFYSRTHQGVRVEIVKDETLIKEQQGICRITKEMEEARLKCQSLGLYSEPLEFIGFLVNGFWKRMPVGFKHAGQSILLSKIHFTKEVFVIEGLRSKRVGGAISIKEYVSNTAAGMCDGLLTLPLEFIKTESFTFLGKATALSTLKQLQNRLKNSGDLAETQIDEIDSALDQLTANHFCMGDHHLSIVVLGDTVKKVTDDLSLVEAELSEFGLLTCREYLGLEACFWAQLPGNHSYIARRSPITSKNFAAFSSFHNFPQGKLHGNHWGEAVALLKTVSNTPYYFNFHYPDDLGNTTVIGPSGAGKTVLILFLAAMLEKDKPTIIFFDKDRGAEIYIRAQGGNYSPIEAGVVTGFNPLQLPDSKRNREFLKSWLERLVSQEGEILTAEQIQEIAQAINGNYKLQEKDRSLSNIYPFFQYHGEGCIKVRLKTWLKGEDRGWVFDNERDSLRLDNRLIGFDVTDFLDNPAIRTPLLMYLFHAIDALVDGRRIVKILDEGWKLLDDPHFAKTYKNDLKVIRKKNGFNIFGTQEPADVLRSKVGKTIMGQSPTKIFLPNPDADRTDYVEGFKLSEREFDIIRTLDLKSRAFVIKQGQQSVVAELDLGGLDDELAVLSGTTANVEILKSIRQDVGEIPRDWLPIFYQRRT